MNEDMTIIEGHAITLTPAISVQEAKRRYDELRQFTQQVLRKDIDYGVIPGTDGKPTLLKPGMEKLAFFFGLTAEFNVADKIEDWEGGFFYYRYCCTLVHRGSGQIIGNGYGSANSWEKKYRWRYIPEWKATEEEKATAVRQEERTSKKGNRYVMLVVENTEPYDLVNTLDKMAQKRALGAAVLVGTGASEFFTQDLEDFGGVPGEATRKAPAPKRKQERPAPAPQKAEPTGHWIDDETTRKRFYAWARKDRALGDREIYEALGVESLHAYQGDEQDARAAINDYIEAKIEASHENDELAHILSEK